MAKAKRLTLVEIEKLDKQFDEKKKVLLLDGKYEEYIDLKFSKTKIIKLLADYIQILSSLHDKQEFDAYDADTISIFNALCVKHFSSIQIPDIDNIEKVITVANSLSNLKILDELFGDGENAFPSDQILILNNEIINAVKNISKQHESLFERIEADKNKIEDTIY